jgi:phage terminase small subunit
MAALSVDKAEGLPGGVSELKAKELLFVSRLVSHGKMAQAAVEAGYKEDNAGVTAHKVLNRPEVQRFFKKCVGKLADNANEMVQRVYLRSVQAHAAADEAFQRMQETDKMVEDSRKHSVTEGKESSSSTTTSEDVRAKEIAMRDWTRACAVADRVDNLLAAMLGRLNLNVNHSGEVKHITVTKQVMETYSTMRREVVTARKEGSN